MKKILITLALTCLILFSSSVSAASIVKSEVTWSETPLYFIGIGDYITTISYSDNTTDEKYTRGTLYSSEMNNPIAISSPVGGETLTRNNGTYYIKWVTSLTSGKVKIDLLLKDVKYMTLDDGTPNDGSWGWFLPANGTWTGDGYKIRITHLNTSYNATSPLKFKIAPKFGPIPTPTPTTTVPPEDQATVYLSSTPTGASITVDNISNGFTPATLKVNPGTRTIKTYLPGYHIKIDTITLASKQVFTLHVNLTLEPNQTATPTPTSTVTPCPPGYNRSGPNCILDTGYSNVLIIMGLLGTILLVVYINTRKR